MNEVMVFSIAIIMVTIVILTSNYFYLIETKSVAKKTLKRLNISSSQLNFTLEKLVFFESITSHHSVISHAKKENIIIKYDYDSLLFQELKGIRILIRGEHETILLAYLTVDDFRLPLLYLLQYENKISESLHRTVAINQLSLPETIAEIKTEIYVRLQKQNTLKTG